MKIKIGTLTVRRINGDVYAVEVYSLETGQIYGEINGTHVSLSREKGNPIVKMTKEETKAILGIDTPNGGGMYLTSDWASMVQEWKNAQKEIAMRANIVGYVFRLGCDAADQSYFVYDFPEGITNDARMERMKADMKLAEILPLADLNELAERVGAKPLPADGMSYYGWEFDSKNISELLTSMNEKLAANEAKKKEKAEAKSAAEAEKFAEAKRTGKHVLLSQGMVPCNSREEECDYDMLTVYAMPDGSRKTTRAHAY